MRACFASFVLASLALSVGCGDDAPPAEDPVCTEDAQCDDGIFCNGTETCSPTSGGASPLGCVAGTDPCAAENAACIETEGTCDDSCAMPDGDGDGVDRIDCGGNDCDDTDADRYPGNTEICDDGHDEDCDLNTVGTLDRDRDGFIDARCTNTDGASGTDCNDLEIDISPSAGEICNGRDDDCDGDVDEGVAIAGFADADADGRGDSTSAMNACPGTVRFAILGEDCDDGDISVQPVQNEICDVKDNDCDGTVDENAQPAIWYRDVDGDGYGDVDGAQVIQCTPPAGYSLLPTDCNDGDPAISPLAVEACNAIDDDCNGVPDFPVPGAGFEDDDQDGIADIGCGGGDCDDLDPFVGAGLPEVCNGSDDDCDGMVDEGLTESDFFFDGDGDGYGAGAAMPMCGAVPGMVPRDGDCDDSDPGITPGATERCDNVDNDCDANTDEGASASCSGANAIYSCVDGFCEVAQCTGSYGDCDLRASTGCETDLAVTGGTAHCGYCNASCAGCMGGICSTGGVSSFGTLNSASGTALAGMPIYMPGTAPLRSTTSDAMGNFSLGAPSPGPVVVGGGSCYPTMYTLDPFGDFLPRFGPFNTGVIVALETTELEVIGMATDPQRSDRGLIAFQTPFSPAFPVQPLINLEYGGIVGFDGARGGTDGPWDTPTGETSLGPAGNTSVLIYSNVEPGPLEISVGGCVISSSPGIVRAGAITVVGVDCGE